KHECTPEENKKGQTDATSISSPGTTASFCSFLQKYLSYLRQNHFRRGIQTSLGRSPFCKATQRRWSCWHPAAQRWVSTASSYSPLSVEKQICQIKLAHPDRRGLRRRHTRSMMVDNRRGMERAAADDALSAESSAAQPPSTPQRRTVHTSVSEKDVLTAMLELQEPLSVSPSPAPSPTRGIYAPNSHTFRSPRRPTSATSGSGGGGGSVGCWASPRRTMAGGPLSTPLSPFFNFAVSLSPLSHNAVRSPVLPRVGEVSMSG
ncbi:unnamed protein product, partial [Phaeothamnion confervicola]